FPRSCAGRRWRGRGADPRCPARLRQTSCLARSRARGLGCLQDNCALGAQHPTAGGGSRANRAVSARAIGFRTSLLLVTVLLAARAVAFEVTVTVDVGKPTGSLPPIWRFFGADEPNYATQPDGEKLLLELGNLRPGQVYFRAHNLMT